MDVPSKNFDLIQSMIISCEYCQTMEEGEITWTDGLMIDLDQILMNNNIGENERLTITKHLKCPKCNNGTFNENSFVGISFNHEFDIHEREAERASDLYDNLIEKFSSELSKFPYLAMNNVIAKELFELIKQNQSKSKLEIETFLYRCRQAEDSQVLKKELMMAPPLGYPKQGRYNHAGQNHLYLSEKKSTAIQETIQGSTDNMIIWLQKFQIIKPINDLLDLRWALLYRNNTFHPLYKALLYSNALLKKDNNIKNWKPDYFVTCFLMDCAKFAGYSGIIYNSVFNQNNYNLVLFDCSDSRIKAINKPKIIESNKVLKKKKSSSKLPF